MMDYNNISFYRDAIKSMRRKEYTQYSAAHLLCEVERTSPYGMGGSAHSNWVAGILYKGVWLHAHNYVVSISVSSDPNAKWHRGCQDSCAYANPHPYCKDTEVHWLSYNNLPQEIKAKVDVILEEMYDHIEKFIEIRAEYLIAEHNKIQQEYKAKQQKVLDNWKSV